jgi:circadian clock protein KaiB
MKREPEDAGRDLEKAARRQARESYVLKLYVAGMSSRSEAAIRSITEICEKHLEGRYELEIVDIYQHPELAREEQIIAAPTLIKKLPQPLRKLIGNMADRERVIVGLDLRPKS